MWLRVPTGVAGHDARMDRYSPSVGTCGNVLGVRMLTPASGFRSNAPVATSQRQKVFRVLNAW